ncbi:hypothetical protein [Nocardioides sp. L-11A]|uniref:hypothetical protein n=1 Tax=Nocardioides sp. L-11A TaxID=3043848 RepID=UPI00249BDCBA|nr:hypothetical protein QJ852_18135 [Nocardioides sp. L-11A]
MAALAEQFVAGSGSRRRPRIASAEEFPWPEDGVHVVPDDEIDAAVPLALALIPAKGVE